MGEGIFSRLKGVLQVHADRAVSRAETPDVLADRAKRDAEKRRDEFRLQLTQSKQSEIQSRQRAVQAAKDARVWRERAAAKLAKSDQAGAQVCMQMALRLEDEAATENQNAEELAKVNAQLMVELTRFNSEVSAIESRARITNARYQQGRVMEALANARYGDPKHPRQSPKELLERAGNATEAVTAGAIANYEIGAAMSGDDLVDDEMQARVAMELDGMRSQLGPGGEQEGSGATDEAATKEQEQGRGSDSEPSGPAGEGAAATLES
jgi:phage shock protein A